MFVDRFITALAAKDFDTLYRLDYRCQAERAQIVKDQPQFMQEQKLREHYERNKTQFFQPRNSTPFSQYLEIAGLLELKPTTKLIETKTTAPDAFDGFVKLTFQAPEQSPLDNSVFDNFSGKILKEAVLQLTFSPSGNFLRYSHYFDADAFWDNLPLQIIAVNIGANPQDVFIYLTTVGEEPVIKASAMIGDYAAQDGFALDYRKHTIFKRLYNVINKLPLAAATNIPMSVTIVGARGGTNTVSLTIPRFGTNPRIPETYQQLYLREPVKNTTPWRNRTYVMQAAP